MTIFAFRLGAHQKPRENFVKRFHLWYYLVSKHENLLAKKIKINYSILREGIEKNHLGRIKIKE